MLFENRGLRRIPISENSCTTTSHFSGLRKADWTSTGKRFTKPASVRGCWMVTVEPMWCSAWKSFEHPFDRLEDRCTVVLDLIPHFVASPSVTKPTGQKRSIPNSKGLQTAAWQPTSPTDS